MDLVKAIDVLIKLDWVGIIFKVVAVLFSVGYLGFGVIFHQQLAKMEKNALIYYDLIDQPDGTKKPTKPLIFSFSLLQLSIGVVLLIISLLVV